jgi:hypothetical protein
MATRPKKGGIRQLNLPFGKAGKSKRRPFVRKGPSRAEVKAAKENALRLASQAYAVIRSPEAGRIFEGVNPQHIELYRREFGRDIGALKKGKISARQAREVVARAEAFLDRFSIKHKQ